MDNKQLTIEIEGFQNYLRESISQTNLPVSIVTLILKDLTRQVELQNEQYSHNIIQEYLAEQQKQTEAEDERNSNDVA